MNSSESFRFVEKGCEYYARYRIGRKLVAGGKADNLDFLVLDFSDFRTIEIKNQEQNIKLLVDGMEVNSFNHKFNPRWNFSANLCNLYLKTNNNTWLTEKNS